MITINTIPYPGVDEIRNNFETYRSLFLENAIIAFRGAHCSKSEQDEVMRIFGDNLDWWPNSRSSHDSRYEETHHRHMNSENVSNKDTMMLGWHLEHVQLTQGRYVGASWCMNLFQCEPGSGNTFFVDMIGVYDSIPERFKEVLDSAEVEIKSFWGPHDSNYQNDAATYEIVKPHWILGKKVARVFLADPSLTELRSINGEAPTQEQLSLFQEALEFIFDQVKNNDSIQMVHEWQEGDMVISDMFRMAHAVGGGFDKEQRKLDGIFGRADF
jgi:alpha-ketoglutarate-dependent taurine dioxygenase